MSSIANQSLPPLAAIAAADASAINSGDGVLALYRPVTALAGAGEEVRIRIIDGGRMPAALVMAPASTKGAQTGFRHGITVIVPCCSDAAELAPGARITADGRVYDLRQGDTFEVPGWALGKTTSTAKVMIGQRIGLLGNGTYAAEGTAQ